MKAYVIGALVLGLLAGYGFSVWYGARPQANEPIIANVAAPSAPRNDTANEVVVNEASETTKIEADKPANESPASILPETTGVGVYFLDENAYKVGQEPYEKLVKREFKPDELTKVQVLTEIFRGPNTEERKAGLATVRSEAKGFYLRISKGVAKVYLRGACDSKGATYTVANLIMKNLRQFPDIKAIKIYDPQETTEQPDGLTDSIPVCLEP